MIRWRRALEVNQGVLTWPFAIMSVLSVIGLVLCAWREVVGLGPASGLNDGYSWGLYKNFNVTTLTALGSGGYALGVLTWVFNRHKYHVLLRVALLTSILSYTAGMLALTIDIGRPWNILWMGVPWLWNPHSILFEVALCMTAYVMIALDLENLAPLLERLSTDPFSPLVQILAQTANRIVKAVYPYGVALAFLLPTMHQSSLGALMMQAGPRVHPVWQTALLPLLYLVMAYLLGIAFVQIVLMASCIAWKLPMDRDLIQSLSNLVSWAAIGWTAVRMGDLVGRGALGSAFQGDLYTVCFLAETLMILLPALLLRAESVRRNLGYTFFSLVVLTLGGMLYRYTPTTIAFQPGEGYTYFPSVAEILMSAGFIALAVVGYLFTVKSFAILPATLDMCHRAHRERYPERKELAA